MKSTCETVAQEIFPGVRALIAKKLVEVYGFSQTEAAKKLGLSQPAISQYKKNLRGFMRSKNIANDPRFMGIVDEITRRVAEGSLSTEKISEEMCRFCDLLKSKK